jgi:hypothetical protein
MTEVEPIKQTESDKTPLNSPIIERNISILEKRGISDIRVESGNTIELPILSLSQTEEARQNILEVMNECGINPEKKVKIVQQELSFNDEVHSEKQTTNMYTFLPSREYQKQETPIVIYSHGGAIRPETTLKSSFLPTIKEKSELNRKPLILTAIDHRGSSSDEEKVNYTLDDRVADLEVLLQATVENVLPELKKFGIDWNGEVHIIGNSMGGHVASVCAGEILANRLILPQPAAYSPDAHYAHLGKEFSTEIRKPNSWKMSNAFDNLEKFLNNGGDALIIGAERDEVIPGGVTNRYIKEITYEYVKRAVHVGEENPYTVGYTYIPEAHTKTTKDEIESISKFVE